MREIVAAQIGTYITNNPEAIARGLEDGSQVRFLDRLHMQVMASLDLGPNWGKLATGPTLFLIDEKGEPLAARGTEPTSGAAAK